MDIAATLRKSWAPKFLKMFKSKWNQKRNSVTGRQSDVFFGASTLKCNCNVFVFSLQESDLLAHLLAPCWSTRHHHHRVAESIMGITRAHAVQGSDAAANLFYGSFWAAHNGERVHVALINLLTAILHKFAPTFISRAAAAPTAARKTEAAGLTPHLHLFECKKKYLCARALQIYAF